MTLKLPANFWAGVDFRDAASLQSSHRVMSAKSPFDLTLSSVARYDVWQRQLHLYALGL